jgi:DNA-binding CsgD family transcriptional regulator
VPVGILDHVTHGDPQRSARYRDLLLPADIPQELRRAFLIRGRVWGAVHIARRASSGAFQLHPGESGYTDETIAIPVLALASFVRSAPDGGQDAGNVVTVPGSDGWVTLHASLPGPAGEGRVATVREREVATLLARGLSRAEMAEALVVSPHTVEDHVANLYEKVGVSSRQERVTRVFVDEYLPEVMRQTPLTPRGRFDREPSVGPTAQRWVRSRQWRRWESNPRPQPRKGWRLRAYPAL